MTKRFLVFLLALFACTSTPTIKSDASSDASSEASIIIPQSPQHPKMGFGFSQTLIFTASSTAWTAPGGIARVLACGCGGGGSGGAGGGGTGAGSSGGGGGGGGGALWSCATVEVVPGTGYTIVVGAGGTSPSGVAGASGNPGVPGADSVIKITSNNNLIINFPAASGGNNGHTSGDVAGFGGMPFAGGTVSTSPAASRTVNIFDIGVALVGRTATAGNPVLYPQAGGQAATTGSAPGANGNASFTSFLTGGANSFAGGAGGAGGSLGGAGGGGGAGPFGAGGNGGAGTSSAINGTAGNNVSAPGANSCAGGGGGSGGGAGATTTGGAGGAGGSGEVVLEF
jgi:hypothetical protein